MEKKDFEKIGIIGVDSGTVMVTDPCYVLQKGKDREKEFGTDWTDFLKKQKYVSEPKQLKYDMGHPGLAIVTPTGLGDGTFSVYKYKGGIFIDFQGHLD